MTGGCVGIEHVDRSVDIKFDIVVFKEIMLIYHTLGSRLGCCIILSSCRYKELIVLLERNLGSSGH